MEDAELTCRSSTPGRKVVAALDPPLDTASSPMDLRDSGGEEGDKGRGASVDLKAWTATRRGRELGWGAEGRWGAGEHQPCETSIRCAP
jgi:hypothetical protein